MTANENENESSISISSIIIQGNKILLYLTNEDVFAIRLNK